MIFPFGRPAVWAVFLLRDVLDLNQIDSNDLRFFPVILHDERIRRDAEHGNCRQVGMLECSVISARRRGPR